MALVGTVGPGTRLASLRVQCRRADPPARSPARALGRPLHTRQPTRFTKTRSTHTQRDRRSERCCTASFARSSSPSSPAHGPENNQPHDSSSRSFMPSCVAASSRTVSCAFVATTVATTAWCPSRASGVASAPPAVAAAWPILQLTSWIASFPRCRSASGCSFSPTRFAIAVRTTRSSRARCFARSCGRSSRSCGGAFGDTGARLPSSAEPSASFSASARR